MATIGDVAREAGVARSTVSAVLTGRKLVLPETRQRVEDAIAKLNFSVNAGARALATSRTMAIGAVVRFHEAEFSPALATYLVALSDAATEQGYSVQLLTERDGVGAVHRAIAGRRVDGLVLFNVVEDDPRLEPITTAGFPAVLLGMPRETRGVDAVDLDFAVGARLLVDHLADSGHREVTFVRWPDSLYAAGATYALRFADAVRQRVAGHGMKLEELACPVGPEQVRAVLGERLRRADAPHALLVHNDAAAAMLPFALHDVDVKTPGGPSVVSLHSSELARLYALPFTSVESEPDAVVRAAVELVINRIADPGLPVARRLVAPHIVERGGVSRSAAS
ncbi:LacI family DNA-binding transcriptional regulator [Myceligenerans pegani]|uniref:LacI family DNA-binding transcriptional regulator n=1 Tax=Myceligenerans pegani TaxID=2776917 RepID=A0ABR9N5V9_9MICO|nr:LacI family DNA-binding transcriptional regulator [Myceligenerans sp. TRM 65318]MBE1879035.1 LacI family DNA-binding transcriptional regulator [Myceligenerans sp. TRM 65318]MBE3021306.1 LacI family DNA-binding transcriptional regulator [Myceligenerans sp. TRM 65318]